MRKKTPKTKKFIIIGKSGGEGVKKNPLKLLLFVLFSLSLATNALLISESKQSVKETIDERYIKTHYFVHKAVLPTIGEDNQEKKEKEIEEYYDVDILSTTYVTSVKSLNDTFSKEKRNEMLGKFSENKIVEFYNKGKFYQFIPVKNGENGFVEIVYDGKEYKEKLQEKNQLYLLQVAALFVFHFIIFSISYIIANRVKSVFHKKDKNQPE